MTVAEFKKKWLRYEGKETSAYQERFNDLCRILTRLPQLEAIFGYFRGVRRSFGIMIRQPDSQIFG